MDFIQDDVFEKYRDQYDGCDLFINTSCEHMKPMKEWGPAPIMKNPKLSSNCYFAFQSNNMFGIEGHLNCVNSLQEFKDQMPDNAKVLYRGHIEDSRGHRFTLIGKL